MMAHMKPRRFGFVHGFMGLELHFFSTNVLDLNVFSVAAASRLSLELFLMLTL